MDNAREARLELERFVSVWGLDRLTKSSEEDSLTNVELLQMYLACSVLFVSWSLVYKALPDPSLSVEQLMQASRKAGSSSGGDSGDKSGFFGSRQPLALSQLCRGASFQQLAQDTALFRELSEALAPAQIEAADLFVMAFHLVGAHNLVAVVEDPSSLFVLDRIPVSRRETVIEALRGLQHKWSRANASQVSAEAAILIRECEYPVLGGLGGNVLDDMHKRRSQLSAPISIRVKHAAGTRAVGVRAHATQPWSSECERQWADDPRFQRYKQVCLQSKFVVK